MEGCFNVGIKNWNKVGRLKLIFYYIITNHYTLAQFFWLDEIACKKNNHQ